MQREESVTDLNYEELLELQERIGFVSMGLTDEEIEAIPIVAIKNTEENCAICQSDLGNRAKRLPTCEHCYHGECIDQWLKKKRTCPVCLAEIPRST